MTIREYLAHAGIRLTDFAALIGVPVTTAHGWVSGRRTPALDVAVRIEEATGGSVPVRDLLPAGKADVATCGDRNETHETAIGDHQR